ncbi:MAG: glycoside hydrolase family 5 protein, partial [Eubacteriales bacterium]|nr:glycoside hydrolase family 5 protein [Eubacteriales bacterium]
MNNNCNSKKLKPFEKLRGGINLSGPIGGGKAFENLDCWMLQKKYYELIAEKGFNNIRLPITFDFYTGEYPDYTINPEYFKVLDTVIKYALDFGFYLILDFHHSCYLNNPYKFLKIWEQIAEHYQDYPEELMFELVNEPSAPITDDWLNILQAEAVKLIRKTNPTRGIAIACNQWNGTWKILAVNWDMFDEYCFLDVHNYYTMTFTHQGANWGANPTEIRPKNAPFTKDVADQITEHLELCADYTRLTGRTIWIGECGVYFDGAIPEESAKYVEYFTKECARLKIPYAWWEFNVGFGLFSRKTDSWKEHLIQNMT